MLELAEKTVIVAELGKLIVDMLPNDVTEPGQQRAYYDGALPLPFFPLLVCKN